MKTTQSTLPTIYSIFFLFLLCSQVFGQPSFPDRVRFQQQATFGYSPALDSQITSIGFEQYINNQAALTNPTAAFPADALQPTFPLPQCDNDNGPYGGGENPLTCFRDSYSMYPLQRWFFKEALYGDAQIRHRVAWALSQVWVTSAFEIKQSRHMTEYYKILYKYALGDNNSTTDDYLSLMKEITLNPAMGEYLDMAYSKKLGYEPGVTPNENYPRELLQLFTIGVNELNQDGTEKCQPDPSSPADPPNPCIPIPAYNQTTINNFAKVFTGWTFCNIKSVDCPDARLGVMNYINPMKLNQDRHDVSEKNLLVYPKSNDHYDVIPPNLNGNEEINYALENIFYHPNVAPFVSKHLIQHLVTSNPSPAYVSRVAAKFINNGSGRRGDMKEVVKAVLLDTEARGDSKTSDVNYGKLREPVQFATNLLRAFNVKGYSSAESDGVIFQEPSSTLDPNYPNYFLKMEQRPFYSPSVFNYYSPKNRITVDGIDLLAPEFTLFTPVTAVARANFAHTIVFKGIQPSPPISGVPPAALDIPYGTALDLSEMENYSRNNQNGTALVNAINSRLFNGTMSVAMQTRMLSAVTAIPKTNTLGRAQTAVYLAITSAEFQVQR